MSIKEIPSPEDEPTPKDPGLALSQKLRRVVFGKPLSSNESESDDTLLRKLIALPIFCSDAISSVAYGNQAILLVLCSSGLWVSGSFTSVQPVYDDNIVDHFVTTGGGGSFLLADHLRLSKWRRLLHCLAQKFRHDGWFSGRGSTLDRLCFDSFSVHCRWFAKRSGCAGYRIFAYQAAHGFVLRDSYRSHYFCQFARSARVWQFVCRARLYLYRYVLFAGLHGRFRPGYGLAFSP